jgi:hypothetical protein
LVRENFSEDTEYAEKSTTTKDAKGHEGIFGEKRFQNNAARFHHWGRDAQRYFAVGLALRLLGDGCGEGVHDFLEYAAPVFIALELVEAGAGGSEQDDVSGLGGGSGAVDCIV